MRAARRRCAKHGRAAEALAAHLGTCRAPEFGREPWVRRDGELSFDDLLLIAATQIRREDATRGEVRGRLCATPRR
ncbi:MAG: hypothetical protein ABIT83_04825 [Massilia sp.]